MSHQPTIQLILANIATIMRDANKTVEPDADLSEQVGMTSIQLAMLVNNVAREFHVDILDFSDEELMGFRTVTDLARLFDRKRNITGA